MKKNYSNLYKYLKINFLVVGLCFFQFSFAQDIVSTENGNWHEVEWNPSRLPEASDDVDLSHSLIIEKNSVVEINNLDIGQSGALTVNGTLVVNGNIDMANNGSYFEMGDSAQVIIFGDFLASNKVDVSISSYLIIHGSFNKKGNEGKGNFSVENGNIYIYGDVDGWPSFGNCGENVDYTGTPEESGTCDYGSEEDLANNPDIPDELLELNNCYDLSAITTQVVCEGAPATFSVAEITNAAVEYEWQEKTAATDWAPVENNPNTYTYTTPNTTVEDSGKFFRVIVRPSNPANSNCKISISRKALLTVDNLPVPEISSNSPVCEGSDIQLTSSPISGGTYQWAGPNGFTSSEQNPVIPNATQANAGDYSLVVTNANGCSSNPQKVTLQVNNLPVPVLSSNSPVCEGSDIELTSSTISGGTYQWLGPNGFNSSEQNPVIPNANQANAGDYSLVVTNTNGCSSIVTYMNINVKNEWEWTGAEDTSWNNTNNWSCNSLPTLETNVLIPENLASGNYPEISAGTNALAKDLTIENNASVIVTNNWLRIAGDLTNDGVLTTETGSVSFEGTSTQIIPGGAFENNRIENLRINNTSGITSETIIEVTGTLNVVEGSFDTGDDLTLISDANQTALIDGSGNGEVIGLVNMQRYLDKAFGYKYFSSPFQNSVVGHFAPYMDFEDPISGFPHFYRYNENRNVSINGTVQDATGWEAYISTGNVLNVSEGYALNFGTSVGAQTVELTGTVNNGVIPARQLENNHRKYTRGFHLVGNPYPSPIDWDANQGWTRNNIDDGIYFFTASDTDQYTGTYTAYVNDISTGDPLVDGRSSNIIPSMQGFFVKVSDSDTKDLVTGSFGMDNNVRVVNFNQEFLRTQLRNQKALIRMEAGFNGANRKDPMVIYFSSYATPNFEKEMDAHKLMNTDPAVPSFYNMTTDEKELAINAIPFPESRSYKKIPLGIKADQNGQMHINLASIENLSPNFNIYLIDHAKSIGQNLSRKPEYTFNIEKGTHNSRFELMFSEEEVINPAIAFNEPFNIEIRDGDVIVKLNLEENQDGILRASTITGQVLQVKPGSGNDNVIFDGITSDGVYIINLQLGKAQYAKKIVIKK
jgi:hypothetical protein